MDTMFLICAIVGGTLIACQFIMTLFGLGGDHDLGGGHDVGHDFGGHDVGGHHDATHGDQSSWFFGILTFKTLSAALAFFGFTGLAALRYEMEPLPTLLLALGAGVCALFLVASLMRLLVRMNVDGTVRIDRSIGSVGTVYLNIPAQRGGVGKVQVSVLNRTMEYKAITASDALTTGTKVVVVGVIGPDTVEVAPATETKA
ncbi:MAG: hypothetical protein L0219_14935 [Phycisphaerales bacterium]|nr:hypothetical protein [Phycisphaerales bacterium]